MARFGLTHLYFRSDGGGTIGLNSTDPDTVRWFSSEIKTLAPRCEVTPWAAWPGSFNSFPSLDPTGEPAMLQADKVWTRGGVYPAALARWVVKQLCKQGWEPFAESEGTNVSLRKTYGAEPSSATSAAP